MKHFWIFGLLALTLLNTACPAEKSRPAGATNRVGRGGITGPNGQQTGPAGSNPIPNRPTGGAGAWGLITPEGGNVSSSFNLAQGFFPANDISRWFLSSDFHPDDIGATSREQDSTRIPEVTPKNCGNGQYCAIEFSVSQAQLGSGGTLPQAMQQGGTVAINNGILGMAFWDALVGQVDQEGIPYSPVSVYVPITQGSYVQGSRIVMNFQDNKGIVQLDGNVSGSQFSGYVSYQNFGNYSGSSWGTSARLGRFQINACAIFRCQ